jgi:glutaredoxin
MYYLYIITLENCPYSTYALELLDSLNIKYKQLKVTDLNKKKYKTEEINTFPQIYLVKDGTKLLLGGYSDLKKFIDIFKNKKKYNKQNILNFQNEYKLWNRKSILRLLEIIIQK